MDENERNDKNLKLTCENYILKSSCRHKFKNASIIAEIYGIFFSPLFVPHTPIKPIREVEILNYILSHYQFTNLNVRGSRVANENEAHLENLWCYFFLNLHNNVQMFNLWYVGNDASDDGNKKKYFRYLQRRKNINNITQHSKKLKMCSKCLYHLTLLALTSVHSSFAFQHQDLPTRCASWYVEERTTWMSSHQVGNEKKKYMIMWNEIWFYFIRE